MFSLFRKKRIYLDHASTTPLDPRVFSAMTDVMKNGYYNPGGLYREGVAADEKIDECRKSVAKLLGTTGDHVVFTRGGTEGNNLAILGVIQKWRGSSPSVRGGQEGVSDNSYHPLTPSYVGGGTEQYPLLHTDAIQAANYLDINVERLGVDLMTLSGSKIYGPKSSGILYVRNKSLIAPLLHGGDQEMGLRAGTEDIAQVIGFTQALKIAREIAETETIRLRALQQDFFAELKEQIPGIIVNGSESERIPNNINISIPGISGERIIIELDARGICASSKSACKEDEDEVSHVIAAIRKTPHPSSLSKREAPATEGSVRFSMGRGTTKSEVKRVVFELAKIINKIKKMNII